MTAEDDGDRCREGCLRQLAKPWVGDRRREQEIRGKPILGGRPRPFIHPDPVCHEHAAVDERSLAEPGQEPAQRPWAVALDELAEEARRRSRPGLV